MSHWNPETFSSGWGPFSKKYADFKDFSSLITIQIFKTDVVDCILLFYHNSESSSTPKSGGIGGMLKPGTRQGKQCVEEHLLIYHTLLRWLKNWCFVGSIQSKSWINYELS